MGAPITLDVEASESIDTVMAKIEETKGFPTARQRLYFQGFRLDFDKGRSLLSYNIKQDSKLQLVVEMEIFVTMLSAKTITLSVEALHPVYTVMETIEYEEEIPLGRQQLAFAGENLEDNRTLEIYNIKEGATLNLVLRPEFYNANDDSTVSLVLIHHHVGR